MRHLLEEFMGLVAQEKVEIYNEFSFQHELGIFLRNHMPNQKIQFERNVSFFSFKLMKEHFVKKEIDICVYSDKELFAAIELKFPRNGQIPEQMYSFCKDIQFLEQLKQSGFKNAYFLVYCEDKGFYQGDAKGIYRHFRAGETLTGEITKPTGKQGDNKVLISSSYQPRWQDVKGSGKFYLETIA
ncbi:hypothetical protein R4536_15635 [Vibrio cholerae]|nr:hypothetical protein R4536_15635 [Vibrio cholerae]